MATKHYQEPAAQDARQQAEYNSNSTMASVKSEKLDEITCFSGFSGGNREAIFIRWIVLQLPKHLDVYAKQAGF
ncbi:hypothetical protein LTR56_004652 [Elasticomyces elasticus]|nr:hypothetical protein LTR22_019893 [Elasticomyces elasticus]KAK3653448.1 hypothetical protein LTR56_004652 [Elasticomyces elasticus]KAK4925992.1 hypothetical protein LTR49_007130 [Elasticomyces elasticus]KAK5768228.1 hypothetical protein LTS12_001712 [Elasticomyces elasticus]